MLHDVVQPTFQEHSPKMVREKGHNDVFHFLWNEIGSWIYIASRDRRNTAWTAEQAEQWIDGYEHSYTNDRHLTIH